MSGIEEADHVGDIVKDISRTPDRRWWLSGRQEGCLSSSPAEVVSDVLLELVASVAVIDILLAASKRNGADLVGHKVEVREWGRDEILALVVVQVDVPPVSRGERAVLVGVLELNPDLLVGTALSTVSLRISVQQTSNVELFRADFLQIL